MPLHVLPLETRQMKTIPIDDDPDFRALEAHANAALKAKGFALEQKKGSSSWTDTRPKPVDAAVCFKLCMFREGFFFGAREEWLKKLKIAPTAVGSEVENALPSPVKFRGEYVKNDDRFWGIVIGAKGHNALSRVMLGSVSDRLVHICAKPVLVIR